MMQELLRDIVKELVDKPNKVEVAETISDGGDTVVLTVRTDDGEVGKVIGKMGKNAQALRVLLEAIAAKHKKRVVLEIADSMHRRSPNGL